MKNLLAMALLSVSFACASAPPSTFEADYKAALDGVKSKFEGCYHNTKSKGDMTAAFAFRLKHNGAIESVTLNPSISSNVSLPLQACLLERFKETDFPEMPIGGLDGTYTYQVRDHRG